MDNHVTGPSHDPTSHVSRANFLAMLEAMGMPARPRVSPSPPSAQRPSWQAALRMVRN